MIQKIELPYSLNALEPYYNAETLNIHYNNFRDRSKNHLILDLILYYIVCKF